MKPCQSSLPSGLESGSWGYTNVPVFPVLPYSLFLTSLFLLFALSCDLYSEEDGEQEDKTIWYYSTKVNSYFALNEVLCATALFYFNFLQRSV